MLAAGDGELGATTTRHRKLPRDRWVVVPTRARDRGAGSRPGVRAAGVSRATARAVNFCNLEFYGDIQKNKFNDIQHVV